MSVVNIVSRNSVVACKVRASIQDLKYTQYEECLAWAAKNKLSYRKAMSQKGERWLQNHQ